MSAAFFYEKIPRNRRGINRLLLFLRLSAIARNKQQEVAKDSEQAGNEESVGECKSQIQPAVDNRNS